MAFTTKVDKFFSLLFATKLLKHFCLPTEELTGLFRPHPQHIATFPAWAPALIPERSGLILIEVALVWAMQYLI